MAYTIQFKPAASRQLAKLPREAQKRIAARIQRLGDDPYPPGCKKMIGEPSMWRLRVSDYRVIYQVRSGILLVLVVNIGHRREVYR